jgi:hypothetical protein
MRATRQDATVEQHAEGERAHRVAHAALKRAYERVCDRWRPTVQNGPERPMHEALAADDLPGE